MIIKIFHLTHIIVINLEIRIKLLTKLEIKQKLKLGEDVVLKSASCKNRHHYDVPLMKSNHEVIRTEGRNRFSPVGKVAELFWGREDWHRMTVHVTALLEGWEHVVNIITQPRIR